MDEEVEGYIGFVLSVAFLLAVGIGLGAMIESNYDKKELCKIISLETNDYFACIKKDYSEVRKMVIQKRTK